MNESVMWWDATEDALPKAITMCVDEIANSQSSRQSILERNLRMYGFEHRIGESKITHLYVDERRMLALNVVRNMTDSNVSDICQQNPKATFLTDGSDWSLQKKAKRLDQFVEGQFYQTGAYQTTPLVWRDACIFDAGVVKVSQEHPDSDKILVERVFPWEIYVDNQSALYGKPLHMFQVKFVDRSVIGDLYPEAKEKIDDCAPAASDTGAPGYSATADQLRVVEAWRLPSAYGLEGRHSIVIDNAVLFDEEYDETEFPFVFVHWGGLPPPVGFWGDSLASQLTGIQYEINKILIDIAEAQRLLGKAFILWPKGCGVPKTHFNNQIGKILEYNPGVGAPQVVVPGAVPAEVYRQLENLYEKAYAITGISQMAAQSQIPAGLSGSGKSMLVYSNETSKRFIMARKAYENLHKQIADRFISLGRKIHKPSTKVKWFGNKYGRSFAKTIQWKDVAMKEESYVLQVFPTSQLSSHPAGRTATVETWVRMGWVDRSAAMRLLEFPDIKNEMNLELASWDLITDMIERMLYADDPDADDAYIPPDPHMDLRLALKVATGAYLRAKLDGCPEGNLQLVRTFIAQTEVLLNPSPPPAPEPPPGMPPMPPGAPPMPPGMPPMPPGRPMPPGAPPMPPGAPPMPPVAPPMPA